MRVCVSVCVYVVPASLYSSSVLCEPHSERVDTSICSVPSSLALSIHANCMANTSTRSEHAKRESTQHTNNTSMKNFTNTFVTYSSSPSVCLCRLAMCLALVQLRLLLLLCMLCVFMLLRYGRAITFFSFDSFKRFYHGNSTTHLTQRDGEQQQKTLHSVVARIDCFILSQLFVVVAVLPAFSFGYRPFFLSFDSGFLSFSFHLTHTHPLFIQANMLCTAMRRTQTRIVCIRISYIPSTSLSSSAISHIDTLYIYMICVSSESKRFSHALAFKWQTTRFHAKSKSE